MYFKIADFLSRLRGLRKETLLVDRYSLTGTTSEKQVRTKIGDVTEILREENNQFTRLIPGEEIELKFPAPEPAKKGNKLSYVLVSRGYYIPVTKLISLSRELAVI